MHLRHLTLHSRLRQRFTELIETDCVVLSDKDFSESLRHSKSHVLKEVDAPDSDLLQRSATQRRRYRARLRMCLGRQM